MEVALVILLCATTEGDVGADDIRLRCDQIPSQCGLQANCVGTEADRQSLLN
jgi:hypothetical protein